MLAEHERVLLEHDLGLVVRVGHHGEPGQRPRRHVLGGGDDVALAAVVDLLESPRLGELGKAARERVVARWTNERLVDRHVAIYEDVIERRRAA